MANLDDEILALAGGDDDSGDDSPRSPVSRSSPMRGKSSSPAQSLKEDTPPPKSKTARKPVSRARKRQRYSDDDEVSEAAVSDASMSEDEASLPDTQDHALFPYEKFYLSAREKAEIDAKPELERESILAERAEQINRAEQDAQLTRMLHARNRQETKIATKRKALDAELDDGPESDADEPRKSGRQRTKVGGGKAGEASSGINAYKKMREEKAAKEEQRKQRIAQGRDDSPERRYSSEEGERESDREDYYNDRYADRRRERIRDRRRDRDRSFSRERDRKRERDRNRSPTPPKNDPPVELRDVNRVCIGRDNFAQVCQTPHFEETITNCFARVCLGPGRIQGQMEYRLCMIKGFQDGRPYAMTGPNGKNFLVNRYIIAAHGKATKPWSFVECSNQKFTDEEFKRWRVTMANEDQPVPTQSRITSKLRRIDELIRHKWTDTEITARLDKQRELEDMINRVPEKREIRAKIRAAEEQDNDELIQELEDQLMNLVPIKLAFGTHLSAKSTGGMESKDKLAELNSRSQKLDSENRQKAEAMARRRAIKKKQAADNASKLLGVPGGDDLDGLFGSASDMSRAGTPVPMNSAAKTSASSGLSQVASLSINGNTNGSSTPSVMKTGGGDARKGLPVIRKSKRGNDALKSLDLGMDIDL